MTGRSDSILDVLWRQKLTVVGTSLLTIAGTAIALNFVQRRFTAEARAVISSISTTSEKGTPDHRIVNTEAERARSASVLVDAIDGGPETNRDVFSFLPEGANRVSELQKQLQVTAEENANVLIFRLTGNDEPRIQAALKTIVDAYREKAETARAGSMSDLYDHVMKDVQLKRDERTKLVAEIEAKKQQTSAMGAPSGASSSVALEQLKQLGSAQTSSQQETIRIKSELDEAIRSLGWDPEKYESAKLDAAAVGSAANLNVIRDNLSKLSHQLQEARRQFLPTHPAVRAMTAQIKDLQLTHAATLRTAYRTASETEAALNTKYLEQKKLIDAGADASAQIASLDQQIKDKDSAIKLAEEQLSKMDLATVATLKVDVSEEATVLHEATLPNTPRSLGVAALVGILGGSMLGLFREWVSPKLGKPSRIADTVGLPVLGTLPSIEGNPQEIAVVTHDKADSDAADAFRSIRTSLLFTDEQSSTIAITSPAPKEGKTTVAANIAISLAQSGKRVLLIDANFKDAALDKVFEVSTAGGFASVLSGEELEPCIQRTPIEHLDLLTAGTRVAGVSDALNSPRFNQLLRQMVSSYDHVIFDLSSVTGNNDARVVAASCDQTLLVVRSEKTNRHLTMSARDGLLSVGANVAGIVVNDFSQGGSVYAGSRPERGEPKGRGQAESRDRSAEILNRLRSGRDQ